MSVLFDTEAARMAERLTAWMQTRVDPSRVEWTVAFNAELDDIDGGWRKLGWAVGGLSLLWSFRRHNKGHAWIATSPRVLARAAYQRRGEVLAFSTSLAVVGLLAFVIVAVVPFYRDVAESNGFSLPLPTRIAIALLDLASGWWVLPAAIVAYLYRKRRWRLGRAQLMRGFALLNIVAVAFLLSFGTSIVDFASRARDQVAMRKQHLTQMRSWEDAVIRQLETAPPQR